MALFSPNAALVFNTIKVLFGSNPNISISLVSYLGFQYMGSANRKESGPGTGTGQFSGLSR